METSTAYRIMELIDSIDTLEDDALFDGISTMEQIDRLIAQAQRTIEYAVTLESTRRVTP